MRLTLLILSIHFSIIGFAQTVNSKSVKVWNATDTLTWGDFNGLDDGSDHAALIQWNLKFNIIDSSQFEVLATMDRKRSWWRITGRHLLRHEQYHFNIAEVFARLIRKTSIEKRLSPNSLEFQQNFDTYLEQCKQMQIQYDKTTEHSKNEEAQTTWEKYIDKQLLKFERYNKSIIKINN